TRPMSGSEKCTAIPISKVIIETTKIKRQFIEYSLIQIYPLVVARCGYLRRDRAREPGIPAEKISVPPCSRSFPYFN
ncbi:MAG: hypothetical protein ACU843_19110, partial [Gammaproteobacteria bacterium]